MKIDFGLKNFNGFYLTQNEKEAEDIIVENLESDIMEIHDRIRQIESDYETKYTVVKMFDGFRHRAKTELIKYKDGLAVKKTWKPGNEKYLEREKFAYGILSKNISLIPKLIESGDNYIIIPYYEDLLYKNEQKKKIVLTNNIGKIASFFKQLYENDLHNPDIHPGQFIYSDNEGLKAIDFEYLQLYDKKPQSFSQSYDIVGCPNEYSGDKPNFIGNNLHRSYNDLWVKYTGYNLEQIAEIASRQYDNYDKDVEKILGLLNYAKTSGESYDGSMYDSAYHSLYIKGYYFRGQRECDFRLENVPYDFSDKVVLDIGCNAGGMLHSLKEKIKMGIGIDYDSRLINAANAIKSINRSHNLSFYTFNLEKEDLALIKNFIISKDEKVDICFLLSVCMWIDNWKEVVSFVSSISQTLLFETNGSYSQQIEQIKELEKIYNRIELIEEESRDDPGQSNRKLFLCYNNILEI
ncbi:MAG TPA: hypothetical protein DCG60_08165 [Tissierella sp.]|nr:hypothetical protein [Tissierella sp.]